MGSNSNITVSIIIPAYNADNSIKRAIESAQVQTINSIEILVIDDQSTDETAKIVKELQVNDPRIRYILHPENLGAAGARNTGIEAAEGEWIAVLDADDAYLPNRLEQLINLAEKRQLELVCDNQLFFDNEAKILAGIAFPKLKAFTYFDLIYVLKNDTPFSYFPMGAIKPVIKRSFLETHAIRYLEKFRFNEDMLFLMEIICSGAKVGITPEPYYIYTMPVGPLSGKKSSNQKSKSNTYLIIEAMNIILNKYSVHLTRKQVFTLKKRLRTYKSHLVVEKVKDLRNKNKTKAVLLALTSPYIWRYFINKIIIKIMMKVNYNKFCHENVS